MVVLRKKTNLPVRKKSTRRLEEYFFGEKTKDAFTYERAFYREFLEDIEAFKIYLKESFKQESKYLIFYKYIPNLIEGTCLTISFCENKYGPAVLGVFLGELLRTAGVFRNPVKESRKVLEYDINSLNNGQTLEEYALEKSGHWGRSMQTRDGEGEEWKDK